MRGEREVKWGVGVRWEAQAETRWWQVLWLVMIQRELDVDVVDMDVDV